MSLRQDLATGAAIAAILVAGLWLWDMQGLSIWTGAAFGFCL